MQFNNSLFAFPNIEATLDRQPLIISPDTSLKETIALMCQIRRTNRHLRLENSKVTPSRAASCALVMDDGEIKGIITERDIVKSTASGISLTECKVANVMSHPVITLKEENLKDIFATLFTFRRYKIRHLPLIDNNNRLIGIISPETIRQAMRPANLLKLRRIADVMQRNVITADVTASVLEIARLMTQNRISCVVITREDLENETVIPVGIITERDIMQFQFLELNLAQTMAEEVMSTPLFLMNPEDSLLVANKEMTSRRIRRLVVSWNWGRNLGIVTQTSLLKIFDPMEMYNVIESLQHTVQQLEQENKELKRRIQNG